MSIDTDIIKNYDTDDFEKKLMDLLGEGDLTTDRLSRFDEMHTGGRAATEHLIEKMNLSPGMAVLDVGSGLGGPARYVAEKTGASVTGIDLVPAHTRIATALSARTGLADKTTFHTGSALSLPFADASFDAAYTMHVAMNIEDKLDFYREIHRVLKPGAVLGIYDVFHGDIPREPYFPLPWALTAETNFLLTINDMMMILDAKGFLVVEQEKRDRFARDVMSRAVADPVSAEITTVRGEDFGARIANFATALEDSRCSVWQVIYRKFQPGEAVDPAENP